MSNIKPVKTNLSVEQALRRAMQVPPPAHDPAPPKAKRKAAKKKTKPSKKR